MPAKTLTGKKKLLISVFLFSSLLLQAQIRFNDNLLDAYESILSLRFDEASAIIKQEEIKDPANLFPVYLEDYTDFLAAFISESSSRYDKYSSNHEKRLSRLTKGDKTSPYLNMLLGNMQLQMALTQVRFRNNLSAAANFSSSYGYFEKNEKQFSGFLQDNSGLGLVHILAGLIPDNYQWMLSIVKIRGDVDLGMSELQTVLNYSGNDRYLKVARLEALFLMILTGDHYSADEQLPLRLIRNYTSRISGFPQPDNPLWIFVQAKIFSSSGMNDQAIAVLDLYRQRDNEFPFVFLNYMKGMTRLNRLDQDADVFFRRYLANTEGRNFVKSSYWRLAWDAIIKGDTVRAEQYRRLVISQGTDNSESDKQAKKEAESGNRISVPLLKARLLCDGGYYDRSEEVLSSARIKDIVLSKKDLVEYYYRLGRINQEKGNINKAAEFFNQTIRRGSDEPWYFAANAALQSGIMMETQGNNAEAIKFYNLCLSMQNTEYKTSLDMKAKAGLKRVSP